VAVTISVVLPVYNEELTVAREVSIIANALRDCGEEFEIIVVDDASTDRSAEIASAIPGITLIRHQINRGSGGARKTGTRAARGEIVVWTDVDLTYPNQEIPTLVKELRDQGLDQVVGARDSEQGRFRIIRTVAKYGIRRLAEYLTRCRIPDLNSGLRAFRRDVALRYLHLVPDGFSCTSTMTLSFLSNGHSVGFHRVRYAPRVGHSKFHIVRDTYHYLLQVIRMVTYFDPLRVFIPLSFGLLVVGLASSTRNIVHRGGLEESDILIFLAAGMVGVIGLLADLIVMQARRDRG